MKKTAQQRGIASIVVVGIVLAIAVSGAFLYMRSRNKVAVTDALPPVSERINPAPSSPNSIDIKADHFTAGSTLSVDKVAMAKEGYVVITKDDGKGTLLGKSKKLPAGESTNITVTLSKSLVDGDVVLLSLTGTDNVALKDDNGNLIQVQKVVGTAMTHYMNEY